MELFIDVWNHSFNMHAHLFSEATVEDPEGDQGFAGTPSLPPPPPVFLISYENEIILSQ